MTFVVMSSILKALVLCFVVFFAQVDCGLNILAIETIGGLSHWKVMSGVLQILVDQGNNVTAYTPFPEKNIENYTQIDLSEDFATGIDLPLATLRSNFTNPYKSYAVLRDIGRSMCDKMFSNMKIMAAIEHSSYDLVIIEPLWSDCVSYVAAKINRPMLYVTTFSAVSYKEPWVTGGYSNPLVYANVLLPYSAPITFHQKMENVILFLEDFVFAFVDLLSRVFHSKPYEMVTPVAPSFVMVNSHYLIENPRPGASKVLNVGGVHLNNPKSLPPDIEEFINNSTNGVIYFALGSTLKMSSIPNNTFMEFIAALEKIPMNVILKYEEDNNFDSMKFMAKKWLPQRDILVHPNVKLFISHGGMCGILETLDAAVPVVGIPTMGDQFRNIDNLVKLGMAVSVPLDTVTEENIFNNINEVLNNKEYVENAKKASDLFKKSVKNNKEVIAEWTKYAAQNKIEQPLEYERWKDLILIFNAVFCIFYVSILNIKFFRFINIVGIIYHLISKIIYLVYDAVKFIFEGIYSIYYRICMIFNVIQR